MGGMVVINSYGAGSLGIGLPSLFVTFSGSSIYIWASKTHVKLSENRKAIQAIKCILTNAPPSAAVP
jgi:hypothetical protein